MKRKTLITLCEWVAAVALLFLLFKLEVYPLGTFRSADATHALSERSLHYGPSKVAKKVTVPFDSHQIVYLGTYKDWFSADLVVKRGFGWELGSGESGIKIDRSKPLTIVGE
ncbi:hypothetical protein D7Z26_00455 [Cohnella endophytica]|uniref:Uncharacterized protein n=1 Tax=Cohnella endophytica TaxID=2419778 RepID=A0A494Y8U9_9BACL|nr:hypothetical protein [Cohnella endophytica]RKP58018.1 hypothetical protein D7Z26_00455 [Cohnella endophytica]